MEARPDATSSEIHTKPRLSFWEFWNMSFGFLGIQFGFALPNDEETLLGYVVGERVLVLANTGSQEGSFEFELPKGKWRQVADPERVDLAGVEGEYGLLPAGPTDLRIPGGAFLAWVRTSH
jgi:hypothetical protein